MWFDASVKTKQGRLEILRKGMGSLGESQWALGGDACAKERVRGIAGKGKTDVCKALQGISGGPLWWRDAETNLRFSGSWEWRKALLFPSPLVFDGISAISPSPPRDWQTRPLGRGRRKCQAGAGAGKDPI